MGAARTKMGSRSRIAAMVLLAGSIVPSVAFAAPQPRITTDRAGTSISFNGAPIRTSPGRIANQRVFTFDGSPKALVVWDEYAGAARTSWFALSLDGARVDQVRAADNAIRLRCATFDPLAGVPVAPPALSTPADNELFLVQFVATPLDEMRRDITALGGTVEAYIPGNCHIVRMGPAARARVAKLPYVRWIGVWETAYRMSDEVRAAILTAAPNAPAVRYSIACFRSGPAQQNAIAGLIRSLHGVVDTIIYDQFRLEATLTPAQALAVARRNETSFIDPSGAPYSTDMDIARQIGGAVPILSDAHFLGQGVRGEVFDNGAITNHEQWNGQAPLVLVTSNMPTAHGTACYGINFATGNPTSQAQATGMCPKREQGMISNFLDTNQAGLGSGTITRMSMNIAAVDPNGPYRSCYQSSSVGSPQTINYTTVSQEVDDYLFKIDYLSIQSQSNTSLQTSRPQAWAKNIVSVGGLTHNNTLTRTDDGWFFPGASFGPAQDGRVKPDLTHFVDWIHTTFSTDPNSYGEFSGTSGATPIVAGHFGLLMQMWHEGVWSGFGGGASVFADRPFSTTAKALIIAASFRYDFLTGSTNNLTLTRDKQGWGMPDLGKLYLNRATTFIVNADQPVQNAQTRTYTVPVAAGTPEFLCTMCYIDPAPGTAEALPNRVNDLDLKVTAPDGATVYWGNSGLIGANYSTPGGAPDTVDTVENVFIQHPMPGDWTVQVIGSSVVVDAYPTGRVGLVPTGPTDAGFSLVVLRTAPPPPVPCYVNCDGSTTAPCLNILDFNCFMNRFTSGDTYANCDGSTAPPVLNALDFTCFMYYFSVGCTNC